MAIMIPSAISPDIKSNAERHIFSWFKNAPETEEWIVLHSLGIINHNRVIHGEVDFIVLVPSSGIFALEIKGGRVKRTNGIWSFTDKYGHTDFKVRGPFDQAWDGIYSIRTSIAEKLDKSHQHLKNILFGIGVMFPDIDYESVGIDEEQWQVFDCNDGKDVRSFVMRIAAGAQKVWERLYGQLGKENKLSLEDVHYLASLLRGDFDKAVSLRMQFQYTEEKLISLTREQYKCIDQLEDNPRCLIKGWAGTGKTFLAIEETKKAVANNERVALFCYNNMLGNWMKNYFKNLPGNLQPAYTGTLHSYMLKVLATRRIKVSFPQDDSLLNLFYREQLPNYAASIQKDAERKFDRIIIDEAQDLITVPYLEFLNVCLSKGLSRGKWTMFGDLSMQSIYTYDMSETQLIDKLEEFASFIRFKLTTNCRNTKYICEEVQTITGFSDKVAFKGIIDGPPVQYFTYSTAEEEKTKLVDLLTVLTDNHVEYGEITILSPKRREDSVVGQLSGITVKNYCISKRENITFSTIQSFKGLENTVIILTDVESFCDIKLMYVGLSRARSGLYIFETETANKEYGELIQRRYFNG